MTIVRKRNLSFGACVNRALGATTIRAERQMYKRLLRQHQRGMTKDEAVIAWLQVTMVPKAKHKVVTP